MDIEDIGAFEAKTRLSELLDKVARGRIYRITKRGRPVAELRPVTSAVRRPAFGSDRGRVVMEKDFDGPLGDFKDYPVRLLLDTHAVIWFATGDRRLSRTARRALEADGAALYISAASIWEMAIKVSLGRLRLPASVEAYVLEKIAEGYQLLPITWSQAAAVERLPFHHRDPFDRLLAAQALDERWPLVSRDRVFRKYGVEVVW